ncbi:MAG: LPS-assembly protein LptD, partial [Candidatus Binatia bacterium]
RRAAKLAAAAAFWLACGWSTPLLAQTPTPTPGEEEITVDAESLTYDRRLQVLSAEGDVVIQRGDTVLRADQVQLNRLTNEAEATGHTWLTGPEAEIRASEMAINMENETGELRDAQIYSAKLGYSLSGKRIEKGIGQTYRIEGGRFTTCNCEDGAPSWSIAGDTLDVALDGYADLTGGTFEILDYPVFWLPRAAFPVYRERQSGLLFPRVGFSNRRGFQLLQPYYWAINKNQDVTVSLDIETSLRVGLLGEYRYALGGGTEGAFQAGYFNEFFRGQTNDVVVPPGADPNVPENRWGVIGGHRQWFGSTEGYVDLLLVGDDLFLREMNVFTSNEVQQTNLRTLPFTTSQTGLLQRWDRAFLQGEVVYYQDLVGPAVEQPTPTPQPGQPPATPQFEDKESLVIQRIPDLRLTAQKQLGFGLMSEFGSSVTNFERSTGLAGVRADFKPALQLRLPLGRSVFGAVHAAFRETAYGLSEDQMSGGFTGTDPDGPEIDLPSANSREIVELRGEVGTQFGRVFDFPYFGLDKLKHTVEPQLEYLYIPPVNQDDLPVFDGLDRINKRSLVTYGFATRLLGRSAGAGADDDKQGEVFELTRLSVAQSYDFIRDIPPTSLLDPLTGQPISPGQQGDHFSDIDFALRVNPSAVTSVRAFATYDTSQGNLSSATVGIRLREPARIFDQDIRPRLLTRATFDVEYRFITDTILQLLDSSIALPVTDRVAFLYAMRYDINADTFLENYFGLRLLSACDCWALNLGVTDTRNPNELQVQAQFTLAGLGGSGPVAGLTDY